MDYEVHERECGELAAELIQRWNAMLVRMGKYSHKPSNNTLSDQEVGRPTIANQLASSPSLQSESRHNKSQHKNMMTTTLKNTVNVVCLLVIINSANAEQPLVGRVISVADGDTLTVQSSGRQIKVRLSGIDAPERDQPFGEAAQQNLARMVLDRTVNVVVRKIDNYGRSVGQVSVAWSNIEAEQVRQGLAWVYRQYSHDRELLNLEAEAKNARRGLWADSDPIAPWDWRHHPGMRPVLKKITPAVSKNIQKQCGAKHTCSEMLSCEGAKFYLNQCNLHRLDRDADGIPCEALCR